MACGGFTCTKNVLTALNVLYIIFSIVLICIAAYAQVASIVTNLTVIGGIVGCCVFLLLLSFMGLIGARKHHQVILFFYMIILFILFVVQFSIACACLAVSDSRKLELAQEGWLRAKSSNDSTIRRAVSFFNCCGFNDSSPIQQCVKEAACCPSLQDCHCLPCKHKIVSAISRGLDISGSIGIAFSLTEFIGVWLTIRYRNQKNPRADPSAFL